VPAPSGDGAHETSRFAHETSRFAHETSRSAHETSRSAHETSRSARETSRSAHETSRSAHETSRFAHETSRFAHETSRSVHETSRLVLKTSRFALTPSGTRRPNRPPLPVSGSPRHPRFPSVRSRRTAAARNVPGDRWAGVPAFAGHGHWRGLRCDWMAEGILSASCSLASLVPVEGKRTDRGANKLL
jgi:hypothetical protein